MTRYICTLPTSVQEEIAKRLDLAGISGVDFSMAMNSRLIDLEDTIEIGGLL